MLALSDEALRDLRGETLQGELRLAVTDYFRPGDLTRLLEPARARTIRRCGCTSPSLKSSAMEAACGARRFRCGPGDEHQPRGPAAAGPGPAA